MQNANSYFLFVLQKSDMGKSQMIKEHLNETFAPLCCLKVADKNVIAWTALL